MKLDHRTDGIGISQEECAKRLGCSRAYIYQVEQRALKKLKTLILEKYPHLAELDK